MSKLMKQIEELLHLDDRLVQKASGFYFAQTDKGFSLNEDGDECHGMLAIRQDAAFQAYKRDAYRKLLSHKEPLDEEKILKLVAVRQKRKRRHLEELDENTFATILNGVMNTYNDLLTDFQRNTKTENERG